MSTEHLTPVERAQDLVIARNTCGLSQAEADELRDLLSDIRPDDIANIERTVDATRRAVLVAPAMPDALRERLMQSARSKVADAVRSSPQGPASAPARSEPLPFPAPKPPSTLWRALAVAACIAVGVLATQLYLHPSAGPNAKSLSAAQVDAAADVVRTPFKPGEGPLSGATGEIVWSDALQGGYMKLTGVKPNDPAAMQYQLWIVDPSRDAKPVDGGVFDIAQASTRDGSVIVPFSSRLKVASPKVFAITAEKPGGVVVSAGPLIMVASR